MQVEKKNPRTKLWQFPVFREQEKEYPAKKWK